LTSLISQRLACGGPVYDDLDFEMAHGTGDQALRRRPSVFATGELYKENTSKDQTLATFIVIPAASAPKPVKTGGQLASRMREFDSYIAAVKSGQVGKLAPSASETARGISLRVARAAKRQGKAVETWVADSVVYFKVV
jgi:hypothetical protein